MTASYSKEGSRHSVRFERQLKHSPEKVWRLLTEGPLLKRWFPSEIVGVWSVGEALEFPLEGVVAQGAQEEDFHGEVLAVEPSRLLEFRWGRDTLRYELTAEGNGCRLLFVHTFDDRSTAARNAAGWAMCFANLEAAFSDQSPAGFDMEAWQSLFERYVAEFEEEAGAQQGAPSPAQ